MAELPAELTTQILERLPVKTLLRFRSVCKSLKDTIDSRHFINSHLTTTSDDQTHRKLIFIDAHFRGRFLLFDIDDGILQAFHFNIFQPQLQNLHTHKFFGHCNGLILLSENVSELHVWNPSTRNHKKLPQLHSIGKDDIISDIGFGYDSSSDDYKVVVVKTVCTLIEKGSYSVDLEIWVIGLRSCCWRMIGNDDLISEYLFRYPHDQDVVTSCFADGALYFSCNGVVIAFDVAEETFSRISLPNSDLLNVYDSNLMVLEGCLCISFLSFDEWEEYVEVFVRGKDGVEFSWTKLLSITTGVKFMRLLGYSMDRDKIFILDDRCLLYSYDLKEESLQRIEIQDMYCQKAMFYIESLVPVDFG